MKQSTFSAVMANSIKNLLQGYTKGIRFLLVMFLILTVSAEVWAQYTKASSIAVGDVVVLVYESETTKMELSGISTTSTKYGIGASYSTTPAGEYELTIEEGSSSGTYSLKNGDSYLYWSSGNSLATNNTKSENSSWTITFNKGNAVIKNASTTTRQIYWNTSSPRFACYTSAQASVQLYKKAASYTITAQANNTTYGTVSLSGTTITATPETGYRVSTTTPYTISPSGSATVTQNGNTFTVTPSANTTITINFEALPKYIVTLKDDNSTLTQSTAGGSVTLPTRDGCDGYTFAGWTKSWSVAQTTWTTTAPTIIPAGSYTPTANENLYPVYTKTEGGGTSYQFQQVTALSQIKAGGTFIITNGSYYLPNAQATNSGPAKANMVEVTDGVVTGSVTDDMKWTFSAADANGKITIKSAVNSSYYLYTTSDNNGLRVNATSDTWTFEEYTVSNVLGFAMKSTSQSRYCAVYTSGSNWRSYTTKNASNYGTNSGRLDLYKSIEVSSTTTSYISVPECSTETLVSVLPKIMNF